MTRTQKESLRNCFARSVKKADQKTNFLFGRLFRCWTNPNTRAFWDKRLGSYADNWRDFNYQYLLTFLPVEKGAFSLLDIGCAIGDGCALIKKSFPQADIAGADFSEVGIAKAQRKGLDVRFFVLDILKDVPDRAYDYIITLSTLEHFNEPYPVVDKCLRYVRKALFVMVPYERDFDNPRLYSRSGHRFLFDEQTFQNYRCDVLGITELFKETGYRYILYRIEP